VITAETCRVCPAGIESGCFMDRLTISQGTNCDLTEIGIVSEAMKTTPKTSSEYASPVLDFPACKMYLETIFWKGLMK
jgi:hypothetical protein